MSQLINGEMFISLFISFADHVVFNQVPIIIQHTIEFDNQLTKKFPAFYVTRRFIPVSTGASQTHPVHTLNLISIFHCLVIPKDPSPRPCVTFRNKPTF